MTKSLSFPTFHRSTTRCGRSFAPTIRAVLLRRTGPKTDSCKHQTSGRLESAHPILSRPTAVVQREGNLANMCCWRKQRPLSPASDITCAVRKLTYDPNQTKNPTVRRPTGSSEQFRSVTSSDRTNRRRHPQTRCCSIVPAEAIPEVLAYDPSSILALLHNSFRIHWAE